MFGERGTLMNQAVRDFVGMVVERQAGLIRGARVLEIGSYDVNGTVRDLFEEAGCASYLGIDKRPGPGVDRVMDAHDVEYIEDEFSIVVTTEMLEHCDDPLTLAEEISTAWSRRPPKKKRLLIATTRGIGYGLHDEPEDYWRFTAHGLRLWFRKAGFEPVEVIDHVESKGVFGYGTR